MNDKEWDLAQEMLARYEAASEQNLEAARIMESAVESFGTEVRNFESSVRKLKDYS